MKPVLVSIVKNEVATFPRLVESLRGQIGGIVVHDTGSTDGTFDAIGKIVHTMAGVPVVSRRVDWVDFSHNRNLALQSAWKHFGSNAWLLLADGDWTLEGEMIRSVNLPMLRPGLHMAFRSKVTGHATDVTHPTLIYGTKWRWIGELHEYLTVLEGVEVQFKDAPYSFVHHGDGGKRSMEDDLQILDQGKDDPRMLFYKARTLYDAGRYEEALDAFYDRSKMVGTWEEERWYASYQAGLCLINTGSYDLGISRLLRAYNERPTRPEPLYAVSQALRHYKQYSVAYTLLRGHDEQGLVTETEDLLFTSRWLDKYGLRNEMALCEYYVYGPRVCAASLQLLADAHARKDIVMTPSMHANVQFNLKMCYDELNTNHSPLDGKVSPWPTPTPYRPSPILPSS